MWSVSVGKAKLTLAEAQHYAHEIETALQHDTKKFLQSLFGNQPDTWSNDLTGYDKLRYITNAGSKSDNKSTISSQL